MIIRLDRIDDTGLRMAGSTAAPAAASADGLVSLPGPIVFSLALTRTGVNVDGGGWLHAAPQIACSRCLVPRRVAVDKEFVLCFRPAASAPTEEETELDATELDVDYYDGDSLDLRSALVEQILLDLPMKLLCSEHCQGLCPQCGVNRNEERCDCGPPADPRLSPLAKLRDRLQAP